MPVQDSPRLFDSTWLEAGIHAGVPFGSLHRSFEKALAFRAGLTTTYGDRLRGTGYLQYAPVEGDVPVHYLVAAAGLEALWTRQFSSTLLLSLHYARSREAHSPALQLDGGESEFGLDMRLGYSPDVNWPVAPRLRTELSLAFTEPRTSVWLWSGVDFAWRLP